VWRTCASIKAVRLVLLDLLLPHLICYILGQHDRVVILTVLDVAFHARHLHKAEMCRCARRLDAARCDLATCVATGSSVKPYLRALAASMQLSGGGAS
jgi:hypothetical protein